MIRPDMMKDYFNIMIVLTLVGQVTSSCQQSPCCTCETVNEIYRNDIANCNIERNTKHYKDFKNDFTCQQATGPQRSPSTTQINVTSNYSLTSAVNKKTTPFSTHNLTNALSTTTMSPTTAILANRWFVWKQCFRGCESCTGPKEDDCTDCSPSFLKEEQEAMRYTTPEVGTSAVTSAVTGNSSNNDKSAAYRNFTTSWATYTRLTNTTYYNSTTNLPYTTALTTAIPTFKCVFCKNYIHAETCVESCPPRTGTFADNKECVACPSNHRLFKNASHSLCIDKVDCDDELVKFENISNYFICITADECRSKTNMYVENGTCRPCSGFRILTGTDTCISLLAIVLPVVAVVLIGLIVVIVIIVRRKKGRNTPSYVDMEGQQSENEARRGPKIHIYGNVEILKTMPDDIPQQHDEVLRYTRDPSEKIDQTRRHQAANQLRASDPGKDYGQQYMEMTVNNEPIKLDLRHASPHGYVNEQRVDDEEVEQPFYGNVNPDEDVNIYGNCPAEREKAKRSFNKKNEKQKRQNKTHEDASNANIFKDYGETYEEPVPTPDYGDTYETPNSTDGGAQNDFDQTYEEPVTSCQDFDQTYEAPTVNCGDFNQTYKDPHNNGCAEEDEFGQIYENHSTTQAAEDFGEIYANSDALPAEPHYQNLPYFTGRK